LEDIRTCMACSEGCIQRLFAQRQATCVQNPAAGREEKWGIGTLKAAPKKKKMVVVGGGPAGMEAARVAALRGHEVVLYEKEPELGGQVLLAARLPYRDEFGGSVRYLSLQINKLGVRVQLGTEATLEIIQREKPDAVVVATGSVPLRTGFTGLRPDLPGIPGVEQENVCAVHDVIRGTATVGPRVVLIDDDGHHRAAGTGELLANQGKQVEIITRLPFVGMDIVLTDLSLLYPRLLEQGVVLTPFTAVREIRGNQVVVYPIYTPQQERTIEGVDTVVLAMGNRACNELYRALKGQVKELYAVGDCVAPRKIAMAIYEGHKVGRTI
ncbi:MAG: FAD-dependent oxidoreductase, partial [Candidatus Tectomicrobia bacterium]|nr:FAD-dependent oxidoreductase [Candidatus Tectomicrobia bacterium]